MYLRGIQLLQKHCDCTPERTGSKGSQLFRDSYLCWFRRVISNKQNWYVGPVIFEACINRMRQYPSVDKDTETCLYKTG